MKIKVGASGLSSLLNFIPGVSSVTSVMDLASNFMPKSGSTSQVNNSALIARKNALIKKKQDLLKKKQALSMRQKSILPSAKSNNFASQSRQMTSAKSTDKEDEKKDNTLLYVGLGAVALGAVYFLSNGKKR